jgi:hypothetical protein
VTTWDWSIEELQLHIKKPRREDITPSEISHPGFRIV